MPEFREVFIRQWSNNTSIIFILLMEKQRLEEANNLSKIIQPFCGRINKQIYLDFKPTLLTIMEFDLLLNQFLNVKSFSLQLQLISFILESDVLVTN